MTLKMALLHNFMGTSSAWYKSLVLTFLIINPVILVTLGPVVMTWVLVAQFIFTLAMALKCYPLIPGGLLVIEAMVMGLTSPGAVYQELQLNLPVLLLLMFMVAGIYFMKDLLLFVFTRILLGVRSKTVLSLLFMAVAAVLSAFLDALTVTAVIISVGVGFYTVYHKVASGRQVSHHGPHDHLNDEHLIEYHREDLDQFRAFLRGLLMHALVGTALGGAFTLVGEPQNLLIAQRLDWDFMTFIFRMTPVTLPVLLAGLVTCLLLERFRRFGFGVQLPEAVREVLLEFAHDEARNRTPRQQARLIIQGIAAVLLVLALAFHLAEVGLIGLSIIIFITAMTGIIEEHQLGKAFEEAMPFTALLVVFFGVVAVIHQQHVFTPIISALLALPAEEQAGMIFLVNGLLSAISDNVFVAAIYIDEVRRAFEEGLINRAQFEKLAIAINTGTNLPSVATPNGQAAFLFLLTSTLAPLIRLSYGRMVWMALPYTLALTVTGYLAVMQLT